MLRTLIAAAALFAATATALPAMAKQFLMLELKSGTVKIELLDEVAPNHVARIAELAGQGAYDGIAFHRVIAGFMAQTGDVKFGRLNPDGTADDRAGYGGSDLPNLNAEFSMVPFDRGIVGAARSQSPHSANSQFFIMLDAGHFLNGQYTVWGRVVDGMAHVDNIKLGERAQNGKVDHPDAIVRAWVETAE